MYRQNCTRTFASPFLCLLLVVLANLFTIFPFSRRAGATQNQPATIGKTAAAVAKVQVRYLYANRPLSFERNDGQTDAQVKFISRGDGYTLFLTPTEAVFALRKSAGETGKATRPSLPPLAKDSADSANNLAPAVAASAVRAKSFDSKPSKVETEVLRVKLIGANPHAEIDGVDRLRGKSNYFIGNDPKKWHTDVANYAKVELKGVYPGIDLVYYGDNQTQLEYDFRLAPHANPNAIRLEFKAMHQLALDQRGNLIMKVGESKLVERAPHIYQDVDGKQQPVAGGWRLRGAHEARFQVAQYDRTRPITIDPGLVYSTYLGGSGRDYGYGIAVDSSGNAYVTGAAYSIDFPTTPGAFQTSDKSPGCCAFSNAFVTKMAADGSGLVYSTYLGGSDDLEVEFGTGDYGSGIAVDSAGNAYVTGHTYSASNASCTANFSPYLCCRGAGTGTCVGFPTTLGAFQAAAGPAFVTKLNTDGSGLVYSTYLGSYGFDPTEGSNGIAIDSAGDAYVAGQTYSGFPTTPGAVQTTDQAAASGHDNAFVTKLNTEGKGLVYSTYLGGSIGDLANGIAVDSAGFAYVTGDAGSISNLSCTGIDNPAACCTGLGSGSCIGFPTTAGAFQTKSNTIEEDGSFSAFVAKLNPAASGSASLVYSTYLGGSGRIGDPKATMATALRSIPLTALM